MMMKAAARRSAGVGAVAATATVIARTAKPVTSVMNATRIARARPETTPVTKIAVTTPHPKPPTTAGSGPRSAAAAVAAVASAVMAAKAKRPMAKQKAMTARP